MEHVAGSRGKRTDTDRKIRHVLSAGTYRALRFIIGRHLVVRRNLETHGNRIGVSDQEKLAFQMLGLIRLYLINHLLNGCLCPPGEAWGLA